MIKKVKSFFILIPIAIPLILCFQNCSDSFKSATQIASSNSNDLNQNEDAYIEISLAPPILDDYNTSSVSTLIDVREFGGAVFLSAICQLDNLPTFDCSNRILNLTGLANGSHNLSIQATDSLGFKTDLQKYLFNVTIPNPPAKSISLSFKNPVPADITTVNSLSNNVIVTSTGGAILQSIQCFLDSAPFDCSNLSIQLLNISNGNHFLSVDATDDSGGSSQTLTAAFKMNYNPIPHKITLSLAPDLAGTLTSASFNSTIGIASSGGATLKKATCQLDQQASFDCTNLKVNLRNLSNGTHKFVISAIDDKDQNSVLTANFGVNIVNSATGTINIDSQTLYQKMLGWEIVGEAIEDSPSYNLFKDQVITNAVSEFGVNRVRFEVRSGSENTTDYWTDYMTGKITYAQFRCYRYATVNDNNNPSVAASGGFFFTEMDKKITKVVEPLKQKVEANGEKLYTMLTYVAFTSQMTTAGCPSGLTHHLASNPQEYAELITEAFKHIKAKYGWAPDGLELILEPDWSKGLWPWSGQYTGQAAVAVKARLNAAGFFPKISAPSTTDMTNASVYFDEMQKVPGAIAAVDEISYHRYSGVSLNALQNIASRGALFSKQTAMLEFWTSTNSYLTLHEDLKIGNNSSWELGNIAGDNSNNAFTTLSRVDLTNPSSPVVILNKTAKFIRQYFYYIRSGAQRVGATSSVANFDPLAFVNPNGKSVVVVKALAAGAFSIGRLPAGTYGITYTTNSAYKVPLSDVTISDGQLVNANIPAAGVITIFGR